MRINGKKAVEGLSKLVSLSRATGDMDEWRGMIDRVLKGYGI